MYISIDDNNVIQGYSVVSANFGSENVICTDLIKKIPLDAFDERGIPGYIWSEETGLVKRTQEEMDADYVPPPYQPSEAERIAQLEEELKAAKILLGLEV